MTFKDLKVGDTIYIVEKTNAEAKTAKVISVTPSVGMPPGQIGIYIDVTVSTDQGNKVYTVNQDWESAFSNNNNTIVTQNVNVVLQKLRETRKECEDIVSNIDHYKENITKCDNLIASLDPSFREKQEINERFANLESKYSQMLDGQNKILKKLDEFLK